MSERYTRIFEGESDLYAEGSPVMISAAVLLNDTETGRVIAQMKFRSLSEKRITYLKVRVKPFDMLKNALSPVEFEYTDLSADMYDQFGQKTPVVLPDTSVRSYEAAVIGAAFSDGTVWKSSETEWRPDPEREKEAVKAVTYNNAVNVFSKAKEADGYKKAAELFKKAYGFKDADALAEQCLEKANVCRKDAVYTFAVSQMAEHTVNGYEAAIRNFRKIPGWKDADKQIIDCHQKIEEIKAKEEADRIEAERKAEELRIKREKAAKKRKKIAVIATLIIVACVAFVILLINVIIPNIKYNAAIDLYNAGKYEEAIHAFTALNGYKDSTDQITKCENAIKDDKYNAALELYNAGNYEEAISAFTALNGYKNSTDIYWQCIWKTAKVGDYVIFGTYEQDNNTSNGKEGIEWLVLVRDGNKALLISKYALDCRSYNDTGEGVTWETCSLRKWLNGTFVSNTFNSIEQSKIQPTSVTADRNPSYDTTPGNNTTDKVFLLSISEANKYFGTDSARQCTVTEYCVAQGAKLDNNNCQWWLRSPGSDLNTATVVDNTGSVDLDGRRVFYSFAAVRPALWISLGD